MHPDVIFLLYKSKAKKNKIVHDIFKHANRHLLSLGVNSCLMDMTSWNSSVKCKISVALGGYKPLSTRGRMVKRIMDDQKSNNNKHIVMDRGYIYKRGEYWSLGWGGLNGRADFKNKNSDDSRIKEWGVKLKPWKDNKNGDVLFCLQLPWDAAVANVDYPEYVEKTIKKILLSTDRNIIIRKHPRMHKGALSRLDISERCMKVVEEMTKIERITMSEEESIIEDFNKSWCVVAYNSNSTVEATIHGVPSFVEDVGSMTWDISSHNLDIENPIKPNREQWLCDISYAQWTGEEIKSGIAFEQLNIKEYLNDK